MQKIIDNMITNFSINDHRVWWWLEICKTIMSFVSIKRQQQLGY